MDRSYLELKEITDRVYEELAQGIHISWKDEVIDLLERYGIRLRQKDGTLHQVNISIPTSVDNAIIIGLRYIKNNGSKIEDLFLFEQGKNIVTGYKGMLERIVMEYAGTHKLDR